MQAMLGSLVPRAQSEASDYQDHLALLEGQELRDHKALRETPDSLGRPDKWAHQDNQEVPDLKDQQDRQEHLEAPVVQVSEVCLEQLELPERLVSLVLPV